MSENPENPSPDDQIGTRETESGFSDVQIQCIDCSDEFVWSIGEQEFFRDKNLKNQPKRCRDCKKAKSLRIEATANAVARGDVKIEVAVTCDKCSAETTVPFYPSQGRPVLCRECFLAGTANKR